MYYVGYIAILLSIIAASAAVSLGILFLWSEDRSIRPTLEKMHVITSLGFLFASLALLHGLFWQDYSLQYVANYTDKYLSLFYRMTAFWAGQPGSMLFWATCTSILGTLFFFSKHYKSLKDTTKNWFWTFFHLILCFFGLLLAIYSNPFIMQQPVPEDGNGLNPLLQNPGMIIHPPLLFIGYAGFIIPSCLALAQALEGQSDEEKTWYKATRTFLLAAWIFLTAGILLGAWWAYMELGWGGYWAWDPVENSSLIPWLFATALIHTIHVQEKTKTLSRFNTALVSITAISTFFATYLVRSGIIDSVHAFGQSVVGTPLLYGILLFTVLSLVIAARQKQQEVPLADLATKEGLLSLMMWLLLSLAFIIFFATLWPVISRFFTTTSQGLDASFYNTVCLPLAAMLLIIMFVCPWLKGRDQRYQPKTLLLCLVLFIATALLTYFTDYKQITPLIAISASTCVILTCCLDAYQKTAFRHTKRLGMLGTHLGVALAALGIAFSGPYATDKDLLLAQGENVQVDCYTLTLQAISEEDGPGYSALLATISVEKNKKTLGTLIPERRIYDKFGDMQFSEVDTIPSLGNELYVSLLGLTKEKKVILRFSIKPLVNWLWIGGVLMTFMPLFGLRLFTKKSTKVCA